MSFMATSSPCSEFMNSELDLDGDLGAHCNDAELRLERDAATQRLTIERDQLVVVDRTR